VQTVGGNYYVYYFWKNVPTAYRNGKAMGETELRKIETQHLENLNDLQKKYFRDTTNNTRSYKRALSFLKKLEDSKGEFIEKAWKEAFYKIDKSQGDDTAAILKAYKKIDEDLSGLINEGVDSLLKGNNSESNLADFINKINTFVEECKGGLLPGAQEEEDKAIMEKILTTKNYVADTNKFRRIKSEDSNGKITYYQVSKDKLKKIEEKMNAQLKSLNGKFTGALEIEDFQTSYKNLLSLEKKLKDFQSNGVIDIDTFKKDLELRLNNANGEIKEMAVFLFAVACSKYGIQVCNRSITSAEKTGSSRYTLEGTGFAQDQRINKKTGKVETYDPFLGGQGKVTQKGDVTLTFSGNKITFQFPVSVKAGWTEDVKTGEIRTHPIKIQSTNLYRLMALYLNSDNASMAALANIVGAHPFSPNKYPYTRDSVQEKEKTEAYENFKAYLAYKGLLAFLTGYNGNAGTDLSGIALVFCYGHKMYSMGQVIKAACADLGGVTLTDSYNKNNKSSLNKNFLREGENRNNFKNSKNNHWYDIDAGKERSEEFKLEFYSLARMREVSISLTAKTMSRLLGQAK
jgi:hypothetical protein